MQIAEQSEVKKPTFSKVRKAEEWEIKALGQFLLELYHAQFISPRSDFVVQKDFLRQEFQKFLNRAENAELKMKFSEVESNNIGNLLFRTYNLINTPRGADHYRIKSSSLFNYRNSKLNELDEKRLRDDELDLKSKSAAYTEEGLDAATIAASPASNDPALSGCFEVADDEKSYPLEYMGSSIERRNEDFTVSNMGCFICQRNFESPEQFEEHVRLHGDDSDFELLKKFIKLEQPFFQISYRNCKNSHYLCFSLNTEERDVIIDKIVIVQSRSMFYVNNNRVPYDFAAAGIDYFYVDSHLLTIFEEQPIIIVSHNKGNEAMRIVEQHHFVCKNELPTVNFCFRPNRLSSKITFKSKLKLAEYMPIQAMKLAAKNGFPNEVLCKMSTAFRQYMQNNKKFTSDTVCEVLKVLLQIEDMDRLRQFGSLVQRNVKFRRYENQYLFKLKINGHIMVENILSPYDEALIILESADNDDISLDLLSISNGNSKQKSKNKINYGIVERVTSNRVTIRSDIKLSESDMYKVIFRPARLLLRYQYCALGLLSTLSVYERKRIFFPEQGYEESVPNPTNLDLFNKLIADNAEQYAAVRNIASGPKKCAPYIIFGPPGTGKSTTVVEAILQLYKLRPLTKVLVTAGSNSACDEVALRLCKVLTELDDSRAVVRIYSKTNEKRQDNIEDVLLEASNMYGAHFYPDITLLHNYRIVICTLSVVGKLSMGKFGKSENDDGVFTHIFVDEAAASTEAETLVGLTCCVSSKAHIILSGDHKQLGPILQSDRSKELGLGISLMERLLERDCYRVDIFGEYDRSIQTRLRRNFRSHPEIVNLYNELYYNGKLLPMASSADLGAKWHHLPNPDFPIIFHSVFGFTARERSASLYNDKELAVVMDYVKDLMYFGINGEKLNQSDIGIISPYKKQYLRIQEELNLRQWYGIETGSVETFQGKEKSIIIVSFVRSFLPTLGFLDNARRINVTLSRPKSLLILIGNPKTLSASAEYNRIIEKCRSMHTLVGAPLLEDQVPDGTDTQQMTTALRKLNIKTATEDKSRKQIKAEKYRNQTKQKNRVKPNVSKAKAIDDNPKLGKQMKKSIQPNAQNQQRQNFNKFKKLVKNDDVAASSSKGADKTEIDMVFESLPKVPNMKVEQMLSKTVKATIQNEENIFEMESQIHEQMRKLKLNPPPPTVGATHIAPNSASVTANYNLWNRPATAAPVAVPRLAASNAISSTRKEAQYVFVSNNFTTNSSQYNEKIFKESATTSRPPTATTATTARPNQNSYQHVYMNRKPAHETIFAARAEMLAKEEKRQRERREKKGKSCVIA